MAVLKIVHVCLVGPFSDGFSYQENLMTKYHKRMGHEVTVIASNFFWNNEGKIEMCETKKYFNNDGVKIIRLSKKKGIYGKFAKYKMFYRTLEEEKPNIIFTHCCNFSDLDNIRRYVRKNPNVIVYCDNHCDETNSATNFISKYILHKFIWKNKVRKIEPYVKKFYGVLPRRCTFLAKYYGVDNSKIELLVMGLDDDYLTKTKEDKELLELSIGGKIDEWKAKEILNFLTAFSQFKDNDKFHITIYGSIIEGYKDRILSFTKAKNIDYIGWVNQKGIIDIISNSSYAVFPGRHSVMWEQAVGLGIPLIVKYYDGYDHININNNVVFLYDDTVEYYKSIFEKVLNDDFYKTIKTNALTNERKKFLYSIISKRAIEEE